MIPQNIIDEILNRVSVVEIIGKYIEIKKNGKNYLALCPFHQEKTPSFSISEEKGLYHCFGCGASGNTIKFLMDYQKLSFLETLQELAKMAGIDLSQFSDEKEFFSEKEKNVLLDINREAMLYFHNYLWSNSEAGEARNYLKGRNIKPETVKDYRLGYGGKGWNSLKDYLNGKGYKDNDILKAGLISKGSNGLYDRFRERIIFPILDKDGNTVGFGGRILKDDKKTAKYLNTAENPVFHKGNMLFSLNFARDEAAKKKEAILVEGYMDVIALYQNGIKNVVAPLGTALTESQLLIVKRLCDTVIFIFDGDKAGIDAANRALDITVNSDLIQWVVILPEKKDPYDFVMEKGGEGLLEYISENKKEPMDFKIWFFANRMDVGSEKVKFLMSLFPYLARVKSSIIREGCIKKIAGFMKEDMRILLAEYGSFLKKDRNLGSLIKTSKDSGSINRVETGLISLLLLHPGTILEVKGLINEEMLQNEEARKIFITILQNPEKNTRELVSMIDNTDIINNTAEYAQKEEDSELLLKQLAYKVKLLYINREMSKNSALIESQENSSNLAEVKRLQELLSGLKNEAIQTEEIFKSFVEIE